MAGASARITIARTACGVDDDGCKDGCKAGLKRSAYSGRPAPSLLPWLRLDDGRHPSSGVNRGNLHGRSQPDALEDSAKAMFDFPYPDCLGVWPLNQER